MNMLLKIWSAYVRLTARWPSIASIVPFIPLFAAWWIVTTLEIFPRVFLPGPGEVWRSFVALTWKGILPEYLILHRRDFSHQFVSSIDLQDRL